MSENSLKIRRKFLNKLGTKIDDLNENFILLSHVDKKIFKKMADQRGGMFTKQRGGDGDILVSDAQVALLEILKLKRELKKQEQEVQKTYDKIEKFGQTIVSYKQSILNMMKLIRQMNFNLPKEPAIASYNFDSFSDEEIEQLEAWSSNDNAMDFKAFKVAHPDLSKKIKNLETFRIFMGEGAMDSTPPQQDQEEAPDSARLDGSDDEDKEVAIGGPGGP